MNSRSENGETGASVVEPGVIPDCVRTRLMSVRAYDEQHQMTGYIHLHNAKRGCFSCTVNRA